MQERPGGDGLDAALTRVGDRWSLLIASALLGGAMRFNELQAALGAIASNVLTQRLRHLERLGLVVATQYSTRPPRFSYGLTSSGQDLAGAMRLLARWGAEQAGVPTDGPVHGDCGTALEVHWYCPTCERTVADDEPGDQDTPGFI
ncbi:MAG TPA: helix-turn-helix domain-containing protein [Acidimicrobiales bacterium]|nr:helix-turn-helix domain-containing protein [Acidimicrobiales bacterium]